MGKHDHHHQKYLKENFINAPMVPMLSTPMRTAKTIHGEAAIATEVERSAGEPGDDATGVKQDALLRKCAV